MGQTSSTNYDKTKEKPDVKFDATLYSLPGRGLADQIRWILAATNVNFTQKIVSKRATYLKLSERQLPFGQLPLLQIDGQEISHAQVALRYLARRAHISGKGPTEEIQCETIAETIKDLIAAISLAPFRKYKSNSPEIWESYNQMLKDKWNYIGGRLEAILKLNGGKYLVGDSLTYVDILSGHILTWYVEELGPSIVAHMPLLIDLQCSILEMSSIQTYIRSQHYYPLGDEQYCDTVQEILDTTL